MKDRQTAKNISWHFGLQPAGCQVVPFPADKRVGNAMAVARRLAKTRTAHQADYTWLRALHTLDEQMERAGISRTERHRQMYEFTCAVYSACERIDSWRTPRLPENQRCADHTDGAV